jgi:DNA-binding NtrC family response regulator
MIVAPLDFPIATQSTFRMTVEAPTLLLVDDDGVIRQLLQTILEHAGYTVLLAADASQAIQIAALTAFDMLITDFQMPNMNGFVLAEQITKSRPGLPTLIVSAATMEDIPLEDIVDHDWSFLPKPIDRIRLLETIGESCQRDVSRFRLN